MKQSLADEILLDDCLQANLTWRKTKGETAFWRAEAGLRAWTVRVNDFPEDHLYTLLIDDQEVGSFDEWPPQWWRAGEAR